MTNLLLHEYYYRGKSQRQLVKTLIESNDITNAQIKLIAAITEHDNYINSRGITNDGTTFTSVDNLSLHHAKDHLDSFQDTDTIEQKEAATNALDE